MKANYEQSKVKPPRCWQKLRADEQNAIVEYVRECLEELVRVNLDHEEAQLQKTWLKMMCIANHDVLKAGKIRAIRVLARWKRLYHIVGKFKTNEERDAYLDGELVKIFGKGGYPSEWVDSLEKERDVDG
jgi:hypothetical protein